jgi:prepilin-type N-terminal cleavage/methylation domain-containing protein
MNIFNRAHRRHRAFTMLEMMVAMVASAFLLAGLGSIMFIARQIAYSPTAAARRAKTGDVINQISDELRYATVITQQSAQVLEFVVADRNNDGTAEKIRYEWSGVAGDPLVKTVNGATPVNVLTSIYAFGVTLQQKTKTTTLTTTTDSAEAFLGGAGSAVTGSYRDIDISNYCAIQITPAALTGLPANALSWNLTKFEFHGKQNGAPNETLTVQLRSTGDPDSPTSTIVGQTTMPESSISAAGGFNMVTFPNGIRNLVFSRTYQVAFLQQSGGGKALQLTNNDGVASTGVYESSDAGASWQYVTPRQYFGRVYGTFTTPGPSYNVIRNYVPCIRLALQSGDQTHARVDASIPLRNSPELLASYVRTDFDRDPTTTNGNGDTVSDWAVTGGGTFDTTKLVSGIWTATGALESRPLNDFTTTTTVEARCRNTSVGGNGTVVAIYADRQAGSYAPILVYLQKQSDGTQTLALNGRTSDTVTKQLFSRSRLSSGFIRFRLTIVPQSDVVNLQINDEDQGTFTYPTYSPTSTNDRYLSISSDTSSSEFDYVELRAGTN